jgi:hypothetical protein
MNKDIALKLALEALEGIHPGNMTPMAEEYWNKAIAAIKDALAQPAQEENQRLRALVRAQQITIDKLEQALAAPAPDTEAHYKAVVEGVQKLFNDKRTQPALVQDQNFCPRCGKRTRDLTTIHTCTPPQENT